jgi:hypothetical protein
MKLRKKVKNNLDELKKGVPLHPANEETRGRG